MAGLDLDHGAPQPMHVYTLVITPGPRRSALARAESLLAAAVPNGFDYWRTGGWFEDRLAPVKRPQIDAFYKAQAKRRERFEAEHPLSSGSMMEDDLREFVWSCVEQPHTDRLSRMQREAQLDLTRLTSSLPRPLDETMVPAALVTPQGRWRIRPLGWMGEGDQRWPEWVNRTIDRHRGGHCAVVADCHC